MSDDDDDAPDTLPVPDTQAPPPGPSILLPEVRDGFRAFTQQFEGSVPYMYLDVKGLVTCAVGNLIDPMGAALELPWMKGDGSRASRVEISDEWRRVKAMKAGLVYWRYRDAAASPLTLTDEGMDQLVAARLDSDAVILAREFPDLPTFPAPAQTAILSMAWAMGAGFPRTWPHFSANVKRRAWQACASSCAINAAGNAGVIPRNKANMTLFAEAARLDPGPG